MKKYTDKELARELHNLNEQLEKPWINENNKLTKSFVFTDFKQAFQFMSLLADYAEEVNHHPDWKNVYNRVDINLHTHDLGGLSALDFSFAFKVEETFSLVHRR